MKKHFISFATSDISKTLERIKNEAENSNFFDVVEVFSENNIPEFVETHKEFISKNPRGYGCWLWKPYIVYKYLEHMEIDDILVYLDAGCTINPKGYKRYNEYIDMCINSPFKNISFQYSKYMEYQYTKGDIFKYLNINNKDKLSGQLIGGMFMMQKNDYTIELIKRWYETCCNYNLIDNSLSITPNTPGFVDCRNDQSIFSCLRKKYGTVSILNEVDLDVWGVHNLHHFNKIPHIPFWATRIKY
jgi:hypothetical protein